MYKNMTCCLKSERLKHVMSLFQGDNPRYFHIFHNLDYTSLNKLGIISEHWTPPNEIVEMQNFHKIFQLRGSFWAIFQSNYEKTFAAVIHFSSPPPPPPH